MSTHATTRVVIAGGGFAGVTLARRLAHHPNVHVTLLSDRNYFAYYPQLYHAATGGTHSEAAIPLSELFKDLPVEVVVEAVTSFDPAAKTVVTTGKHSFKYDYLALALGTVTNYFGIKGLPDYSYNIKTIEGAEAFKQHLHHQLIHLGRPDTHYVVVGAGPTGVELAGALSGYMKRILQRHKLGNHRYRIDLVEAAPRVLPRSSEAVSRAVQRHLELLGINVMTGVAVEGETATELKLKGDSIATKTVVWTSGVANNPFFSANTNHFTLLKGNKVQVDAYLQASDGVYVLGDNAATTYSGLAQTAVSDAAFVASDIEGLLGGAQRRPYQPKRPIAVTPVGQRWAVAEYGRFHLVGYGGWLLRRAADLIAYHDIESWPAAVKVWLREPQKQDNCPVCKNA